MPVETRAVDALLAASEMSWNQRLERMQCMAQIQSDAAQLALDLVVRESNIAGFFRQFLKALVEETESLACGVWLLDDAGAQSQLWMAFIGDRFYTEDGDAADGAAWQELTLPREAMAEHLVAHRAGWSTLVDYSGDDARLPAAVGEFNRSLGVGSTIVAPLALPTRNLGWIALATGQCSQCEVTWRHAVLEAMARQATLALYQSRLAEERQLEVRRQAVLEERNRIARDIHDTLTQGFAAILMQLQAARRSAGALPGAVETSIDRAIDLARSHIIEARRSVGALRPQTPGDEDVAAGLARVVDLARRTTDVPIELAIGGLPDFGGGVGREIIGIAQEAVTNAVRHANAKQIAIRASAVRGVAFHLSVADNGRGIAREAQAGGGFGMTSMQERAERIGASLTIVTAPRAGTEVVLAWEPPSFSIPARSHGAR
jgi:signal transduction histidine kinase